MMFTYCILVVSSKLNFVIQQIVLRYYPFHQKRVFVFVSRCKSVEDTEMLVRLHIITKNRGIVGYFVKLVNMVPLPIYLLSKTAKKASV